MSTSLISAIVSACLVVAVWIGMLYRHIIPENHLSTNTKDTVKLAMGLVATMSALLVGLLVTSAKGTYDTARNEVIQMASTAALLDRELGIYGPEAAEVRGEFRALVEAEVRLLWSEDATVNYKLAPNRQKGDAFYLSIQNLAANDDAHRTIKAQATALAVQLAQTRALMRAQSAVSISMVMLTVVVAWIVLIFLSFSLLSPPNATTNLALTISALCVASAFFLILELDTPFGGFISISSEPMMNVLSDLGK